MPKYKLPHAVTFREVLSIGKYRQYVRPEMSREDLAFYNTQAAQLAWRKVQC